MEWLNEPAHWSESGSSLKLTAESRTDFWRKTHDGGIRDNGHFRYAEVTGDFDLSCTFTPDYREKYDHAGLMIRMSEELWIKAGVEFLEGEYLAGVVVTRDWSDWSVVPMETPETVSFKLTRRGETVEVFWHPVGRTYAMLRQCYFPTDAAILAGVMAAAPTGAGYDLTIENIELAAS